MLYDLTYLYAPPGHIPKGLHAIDNSYLHVCHISSNSSKEKQNQPGCVSASQWVVTISAKQDFTKLEEMTGMEGTLLVEGYRRQAWGK